MEAMDSKRSRKGPGGGGAVKNPRRKNKNGMKIKEEKMSQVGPDPGGGQRQNSVNSMQELGDGSQSVPTPSKGLQDDLLLNGSEIKLENPSTPQLMDPKGDCNSDMTSLPDLGHPDFPDCKPPMNPYCYPHYNNGPPGNSSMSPHPGGGPGPGDYGGGPGHPHPGMGGYPPPPNQGPPSSTKQQPTTLEAQYMQQQSQISVFSTQLANKAAEAVYHGGYPSIIAFHTMHPATIQFLQCQGNPNWPPSPAPPPPGKMGKGSKGSQPGPPPPHMNMPTGPPNMPPEFNMHPGHPFQGGPQQGPPQGPHPGGHPQGHPGQNHPPPPQGHPGQGHPPHGHPPPGPWNTHHPNSKPPPQGFPTFYDGQFCGGQMGPGGPMSGPGQPHSMCPGGNQPGRGFQTAGVKIRDEDLTPEQRQHREEKMAKVRQMKQLLFPENDHMGDPNNQCQPMPPHEQDGYNNMPPGGPHPGGPMSMDYMQNPGGGGPGNKTSPNDWSSPPGGGFFMDGNGGGGMKTPGGGGPGGPLPGPSGNGPRKVGGGSIPSPATPMTPGSSCGAPHRPSPHSPLSGGGGGDPLFGGSGHPFYSSGYYSPQLGGGPGSPNGSTVQRKDSESSNSEGGKSRKEKSSCSISPTSSAPPSVKEANLMPVPSPQQILYMNVFEGQELTIQKQPNVGLNEHPNDNSPGMPHSNLELNPSTPLINPNQQKPSLSAPPTPVSVSSTNNSKSTPEMVMSNNSNSKTRPGSVGPVPTPKSSTTPNPSPQGMDRSSQPGTPLQMSLGDMKSSGGFGPPQMMKQMPMGMEYPDGPVGSVENLPLNPDLAGPGPSAKPVFDPISSMVQMSQQLTGGNGTPPNPPSGMNSNGGYGMNPPGGPPMNPNMVNFNTSMHNVQNVDGGLVMGGPQTVNNTYVNATMTIQQMNIQNIPPYMNQGMNPHQMPGGNMGQGMGPGPGGPGPGPMGPMSSPQHLGPPPTSMQQNHPSNMGPMGPGASMGMMSHQQMTMNQQHSQMSSMGMCGMGPRGGGPPPHPQMMYGNQQRMPGPGGRGSPYRMPGNPAEMRGGFGGTNIQVNKNAPNTIQYLPARPPPPHNQSQGPLCSQPGGMGPGPGNGPGRQGPNLDFLQRYTNPSPPVVNVNMGMNVNVNMSGGGGGRMPYPGPPPMGMGNNGPPPPMMRGQHGGMMEPHHQGGPGGGPMPPMGGMKGPGGGGYPPGPPQPNNDPAFHHFQQQLYATGTNNGRNPMPPNVQGNPNQPPNQFYK